MVWYRVMDTEKTSKSLILLLLLLLIPFSCARDEPVDARNTVLILIDTCRWDEVGRTTPNGPVTPEIDRFSEGAVRFQSATAQAPWTLPSVTTLLTSLYPTLHGAVGRYPDFSRIRDGVKTAAESLQESGITTGAFVNCAFLDPRLGLDRGFDTFDYFPASNLKLRTAAETFAAAGEWIREHQEERFFLLIHLFDAHMDYDPPEPFRSRFLTGLPQPMEPPFGDLAKWLGKMPEPEIREFARALYRAEIAAVDHECGLFLDDLARLGLSEETAVVITADHGEEFWDHGSFEHGHTLYDELIHVPLIMKFPGSIEPREVDRRVGLIDVMPTVLDAMGLPVPDAFQGRSLLSMARGDESDEMSMDRFAESLFRGVEWKAVLDDRYKFMYCETTRSIQLYDLTLDRWEEDNLEKRRTELVSDMATRLLDWYNASLDQAGGNPRGEEVVDMEEEVIKKLRALGYVD